MTNIAIALIFNAIDLVSGFLCGIKVRGLDSSKLRDGLFKKVGFIVCYTVAFILDSYGGFLGLPADIPFVIMICSYVVLTELVSIVENVHTLNPDILPEKLMDIFKIGKGEK